VDIDKSVYHIVQTGRSTLKVIFVPVIKKYAGTKVLLHQLGFRRLAYTESKAQSLSCGARL
jgi:hypothetical protein